jgi:hypothetical protein
MRMARGYRVALLAALLAGSCAAVADDATTPRAAVSDVPSTGVLRATIPFELADGAPVARVFYDLYGSSGDAGTDRALRDALEEAVGIAPGDALRSTELRALAGRLGTIDGVGAPAVAIVAGSEPGSVIVVVTATLARMVTAGGDTARPAFPVVYRSDSALLRVPLSGGHGVYTDHNPWFASPATFTGRSPIALDPPGRGSTTWTEHQVEYGLAGAVRIGQARATAFGEVTALVSSAAGQDLFRSDSRTRHAVEKRYAGVAWVDRARQRSVKLSAGRQNWQLYGGFLFSRFAAGSNAGPSPGLYLSPRTTYQSTRLLDARWGSTRLEGFDLDPSELEGRDSGSRYLGWNLRHAEPERWELGYTRYQVPESRARIALASGASVPRQGQRTWAIRGALRNLAGIAGFDVVSEYAQQDHRDVPWDARAWYAQAGWRWQDLPWRPSLTYRYASFSGDNPRTPAQEAFDAPLSSGLDEWVQGVSFKKVVTNTNLDTHRLRLNLGRDPRLNYTFDWFQLDANQPTPSGADRYGREFNAAVRWAVSERLFFLGVAGIAWPGEVIRERTGGTERPWTTVQASLFWGL